MIVPLIREAMAMARSQVVMTAITVLTITGVVVAIMLTTGRTVGAEQRVVATLDSAGTRVIVLRGGIEAGLSTDALTRISRLDGVQWMAGFGEAIDATNGSNSDGIRVPLRDMYSPDYSHLGIQDAVNDESPSVYGSPQALRELGLIDGSGSVTAINGQNYPVRGTLRIPDELIRMEPLLIAPRASTSDDRPVATIIIVASRTHLVAPIASAAYSLLGAQDQSRVTVETSEDLARLRDIVAGQIGESARGLLIGLLALSAGLLTAVQSGFVMLRRRDFGRRRALGASQRLIVSLLVVQTVILGLVASAIGTLGSVVILAMLGDPIPSASFMAALIVLTLASTTLASAFPSVMASRRDPARELRVP